MKANARGGLGLKPQTQVTILTPINSRRYLSYASRDREKTEGTRLLCPYSRPRAGLACDVVAQRALGHAQAMAEGPEIVSP